MRAATSGDIIPAAAPTVVGGCGRAGPSISCFAREYLTAGFAVDKVAVRIAGDSGGLGVVRTRKVPKAWGEGPWVLGALGTGLGGGQATGGAEDDGFVVGGEG